MNPDPKPAGTMHPDSSRPEGEESPAPERQTVDGTTSDATLAVEMSGTLSRDIPGLPPELVNHPRYKILKLLGQGGMGAVYLAEHRKMERRVALKVIHAQWLHNPRAVERFQQEVKSASQLNHPNVVTAFDADVAGADGAIHFLVMEFIEGENLDEYALRHKPLAIREACHAVQQAALGLAAAHERGMVHRDIKPQNLIRTTHGQIKILDFGLARLARPDHGPVAKPLTAEGAVMGTPDYMAPEQAGDSKHVDIRADIYSLGCTLYELLTGDVPFPGGTAMEKVTRHARDPVTPARKLRREIPMALSPVIAKMMAKRPADRYQTPTEVAQALAPFAQETPSGVSWGKVVVGLVAAAAIAVTVWFSPWKNAFQPSLAEALKKPENITEKGTSGQGTLPVEPTEGPQFRLLQLADQPEFEKWLETQRGEGYWPVYLTVNVDGPVRFNAIARPNPDKAVFETVIGAERQEDLRAPRLAKGLRLRAMCSFLTPEGEVNNLSLWQADSQNHSYARLNYDKTAAKLAEDRERGARPIAIQGFDGPTGHMTSMVSTPSSLGWEAQPDLSDDDLVEFVAQAQAKHRRLEWLAMHGKAPEFRYAVVVVDDPQPPEWDVETDLSHHDFKSALAQRTSQGFYPVALMTGGNTKTRFSVAWQRDEPKAAGGNSDTKSSDTKNTDTKNIDTKRTDRKKKLR